MPQSDLPETDHLLPAVYEELRRLAARQLAQEKPGQTLQTTALVHEAYLRLANGEKPTKWQNRRHFYGAAAEAMRRILIENARRKKRLKRGGDRQRVDLPDEDMKSPPNRDNLLVVNEALQKLETEFPDRAQLVKLRYFAGLSLDEAAETLGLSRTTAYRQWVYARAWLLREIDEDN